MEDEELSRRLGELKAGIEQEEWVKIEELNLYLNPRNIFKMFEERVERLEEMNSILARLVELSELREQMVDVEDKTDDMLLTYKYFRYAEQKLEKLSTEELEDFLSCTEGMVALSADYQFVDQMREIQHEIVQRGWDKEDGEK